MEEFINETKISRKHLSMEERLQELERKEQKAKEAEARRKAKIVKLRTAMLAQKRENFEKVLAANGIQTESQLDEVMGMYQLIRGWGISTKSQLEDVLKEADFANASLMTEPMEQEEQRESSSSD